MADLQRSESKSTMDTTPSNSTTDQASKEFHPIKSNATQQDTSNTHDPSRNAESRASSLRAISRTRSHNGYGCDDIDEQTQEQHGNDVEKNGAAAQKDPYEVGWENGESDPANPRSMTHARKWLVVLIVSASSLCV